MCVLCWKQSFENILLEEVVQGYPGGLTALQSSPCNSNQPICSVRLGWKNKGPLLEAASLLDDVSCLTALYNNKSLPSIAVAGFSAPAEPGEKFRGMEWRRRCKYQNTVL